MATSESENTYCRLCAEPTPSKNLFDLLTDSERSREVIEKLSQLKHDFIHMFRDNALPKTVCFLCLDALYRAVAFVDRVESSQKVLSKLFGVKIVKNIKKEPYISEDDEDTQSSSEGFEIEPIISEKNIINEGDECKVSCKHERKRLPKKKYIKKRVSDSDDDDDPECDKSWKDYSWMCAFCLTQFSTAEALTKHSIECHGSCTAFKCIDCNIRKLKLEPFIAHVTRHRKYLKRSCYACDLRFDKRIDVEKHRKMHTKNKYICIGCHSSFRYVKDLQDHKNKYYTDKRATRVLRPTEEDLVCSVCDKKFKTRAILQSHVLIHTDRPRDHICDICGKSFFNKDTLMSHLIVHTDTRPYQCKICKFSFKTIGQLRMHVGTHDSNRPFACEQCGKCFRLRKNLSSHMITHSDTMPYSCEYCSKGFRFKTILNQHIRQHTGVKPYSCNICDRAFTNWSNYNKHMKRRHGMEMAKKKHTPDGVFPINPATGEVMISPLPDNTEEWKNSVLKRRLIKRKPRSKFDQMGSAANNTRQDNVANVPNPNVLNVTSNINVTSVTQFM